MLRRFDNDGRRRTHDQAFSSSRFDNGEHYNNNKRNNGRHDEFAASLNAPVADGHWGRNPDPPTSRDYHQQREPLCDSEPRRRRYEGDFEREGERERHFEKDLEHARSRRFSPTPLPVDRFETVRGRLPFDAGESQRRADYVQQRDYRARPDDFEARECRDFAPARHAERDRPDYEQPQRWQRDTRVDGERELPSAAFERHSTFAANRSLDRNPSPNTEMYKHFSESERERFDHMRFDGVSNNFRSHTRNEPHDRHERYGKWNDERPVRAADVERNFVVGHHDRRIDEAEERFGGRGYNAADTHRRQSPAINSHDYRAGDVDVRGEAERGWQYAGRNNEPPLFRPGSAEARNGGHQLSPNERNFDMNERRQSHPNVSQNAYGHDMQRARSRQGNVVDERCRNDNNNGMVNNHGFGAPMGNSVAQMKQYGMNQQYQEQREHKDHFMEELERFERIIEPTMRRPNLQPSYNTEPQQRSEAQNFGGFNDARISQAGPSAASMPPAMSQAGRYNQSGNGGYNQFNQQYSCGRPYVGPPAAREPIGLNDLASQQQMVQQQQQQRPMERQYAGEGTIAPYVQPQSFNEPRVDKSKFNRTAQRELKPIPRQTEITPMSKPNIPDSRPTPMLSERVPVSQPAVDDERKLKDVHLYRLQHKIIVKGLHIDPMQSLDDVSSIPQVVVNELRRKGVRELTPVQAQAWPIALRGKDIICASKSREQRALGYIIPAVVRIMKHKRLKPQEGPIVLVLVPTCELAKQVQQVYLELAAVCNIKCALVIDSLPKAEQLQTLRQGVELVIATPKRFMHFLNTRQDVRPNFPKQCRQLIIEDVGRMLNLGYEEDLREIMKQMPSVQQRLFWSISWSSKISLFAKDLLRDYTQLNIGEP